MQKIKTFAIVVLVLFMLFSCKKDKEDDAPVFSATGFWRGYITASTGTSGVGFLNRDNGTSRIYDLTKGPDTTKAFSYEGTFTVNGDFYRGVFATPSGTSYAETTSTSPRRMTGIISIGGGGAGTFDVIKQP